jgi:predicted RNase H-like HicB family nuclease
VAEIPFRAIVEFDTEDGGYVATTPTLAGVVGQGESRQEAVKDLEEALEFTLEDMLRHGEPLPPEEDRFARPPVEDEDEWTIRVAV